MSDQQTDSGLIELIGRGGVFYNIAGSRPEEAIADLVQMLNLPEGLSPVALRTAILEREALMPTAVGNGIAIPHPRSPLIAETHDQLVSVGFLDRPIEWQALDGQPVTTLILILSASPKLHLRTLSKVSFLCQQDSFRALLEARASEKEIIAAIRDAESTWG